MTILLAETNSQAKKKPKKQTKKNNSSQLKVKKMFSVSKALQGRSGFS